MKILIAGDFCPRDRVAEKFEQGDFESVLGEAKDVISSADYSIVNFECPVIKGGERPIIKCGPNLHCSEKGMEAVKWAGFDCITLANNHFLDFGKKGVENTLEACAKYGVDIVGGGRNLQEASKILYKEINGKTLAIINCCEHEFSVATEATAGSNPLNPIQQYYAIKDARTKADYVLVIVHGGHEHYQLPSSRMQETYRFFVDAGADAVINHHQHCYSGYEVYNNKPIFYGLGNFCMDKSPIRVNMPWNYGYMVKLSLEDDKITYEVHPYEQCGEKPSVSLFSINKITDGIESLNRIITTDSELRGKAKKYYEECYGNVSKMISPSFGKLHGFLLSRGYIPSLITKKWASRLYNYIMCESHRDKVEQYLKSILK